MTDLLPSTPVDRFELRRWYIDALADEPIIPMRYVYHVDATWEEVVGPEERAGAPFTDEWQVFRNDQFIGRIDGWNEVLKYSEQPRFFRSERAAELAAVDALGVRVQHLLDTLDRYRSQISKLEAKLFSAPERERPTSP